MHKLTQGNIQHILIMNNYVILWSWENDFCWNALWKVESSHEKKSCSLKIKVSEVLLCFEDKVFDEKVLVLFKDKTSNESLC